MTRTKKIIIGASVIALSAMGALAVSAADHGRHERHSGEHRMHGQKGGAAHAERMFEKFDTDKDGKVTRAEIDTARTESIAKYDTSGDGVLQLEEYQGLWLERMRSRMVDSFQRLDDDGDGKVTDTEMQVPMTRISRFLDRDADGVITRDEMRSPRRGEHRGARHDKDDDSDRDRDRDRK